jgi:hypothetical protein
MAQSLKQNISRLLALLVSSAGLLVMAGWVFDAPVLQSLSPAWISMKFDTALSFFLGGITLYYISMAREGRIDKAQIVLSITSLTILLLMGTLFISTLLGINTMLENIFVYDTSPSSNTVFPGRPSMPTMINFILLAVAGILAILNNEKNSLKFKFIGGAIGLIGAAALAGYLIKQPALYYFIPERNSAMACHTAGLFVLLGLGLQCL